MKRTFEVSFLSRIHPPYLRGPRKRRRFQENRQPGGYRVWGIGYCHGTLYPIRDTLPCALLFPGIVVYHDGNMEHETSSEGMIVLTKDSKILAELEEKLGQYRVRLKLNDESLPCVDAGYKKLILEQLLEKGSVSIDDVQKQCVEAFDGGFRPDLFSNAVLVIGTYNEQGLPNLDEQEMHNNFDLSQDPIIQQRLRAKLEYYQVRMDSKKISEEDRRDTYFKHLVLNELLESGRIDGRALRQKLSEKLGAVFSEHDFNNALGVVFQYNAGTIAKLTI